jgi:glycosyltransferase involved in cell wall biosynthesis
MVARFNRFAATTRHEFSVWFTDPAFDRHPWRFDENDWQFAYRYLNGSRSSAERPYQWSRVRPRPHLLVSLYASAQFLLTSQCLKARGVSVCYFYERTQPEFAPRRAWKEALKHVVLAGADAILVPGPDAALSASRYARSNRIITLNHCVDQSSLLSSAESDAARRTWRRARGLHGLVFLYVGALDIQFKGLDVLLDAFQSVRSSLPTSFLVIAGKGDGAPELAARATSLGILDSVEFSGFVQPAELPSYYAGADVFVFPSRGDTYGMVIDEAMASGLPVITTTNVGEATLRIEHERSGLLVPPSDSEALARCMLQLGDSAERRSAIGCAAALSIRRFTPDSWAAQFEEIVDRFAARRR